MENLEHNPEPITKTEEKVSIMGVELMVGSGGDRVPDINEFSTDVLTEEDLRLMRDMAVALKLNHPLLIEGGSGLGKTKTIRRICAQTNTPIYDVNCHNIDADVLVGTTSFSEDTK